MSSSHHNVELCIFKGQLGFRPSSVNSNTTRRFTPSACKSRDDCTHGVHEGVITRRGCTEGKVDRFCDHVSRGGTKIKRQSVNLTLLTVFFSVTHVTARHLLSAVCTHMRLIILCWIYLLVTVIGIRPCREMAEQYHA